MRWAILKRKLLFNNYDDDMATRKTESRIPDTLQPGDLGQAVTNNGVSLISFVTSPLVVDRNNTYVVIITNAGIASSAQSYQWSVSTNGGAAVVSETEVGELTIDPQQTGTLQVSVNVRDAADTTIATVAVSQHVVSPSAQLEDMIAAAHSQSGPGMADPDALRELINEHNLYYQSVTTQNTEPLAGFKKLVFNMAFEGVMKKNAAERKLYLDQLATSLNSGDMDFASLTMQPVGVCSVRILLLAMTVPNMMPWTLLPADANQRTLEMQELHQTLAQLDESKKIDLFNLVRFPKSNVNSCGRIMENLRNRYFGTTNFDDVLTGMSGTRAQWIIAQYRQGPITRT
jgi:hypothetical protein